MIPLDSSVVLTPRSDQVSAVCDVGPGSWDVLLNTERCRWGPSGALVDVSTMSQDASVMQERSTLDLGASLSNASRYLTLNQVNLGVALGSKDYTLPVSELGPSFGASENDPPFSSLIQESDCSWCTRLIPENCLGLVLTDLNVGHVSDPNYPLSTASATSRAIHPYPPTSSFHQDNCETSGLNSPPMDILRQYTDCAEPAAFLNEIRSSDFEAWIDNSSALEEISQMVDFEVVQSPPLSAHLPLEQYPTVSEEAVCHCEWINENGAVCGGELSRSTLSGHLSMHGIKRMPRDKPTKCRWAGCRRKRPINRESIARHVREVHLRVKRLPKRVQKSRYENTASSFTHSM